MRCIITPPKTAAENMAVDEALLQLCTEPVVRFYRWHGRAISIGCNQDPDNEINIKFCKQHRIDIVRRITGGKAVLHDKEVTYAFISPEDKIQLPKEVNESFKVIAEALVQALKLLGIHAQMKKQPEKVSTSICFNSSNWYELEVNNRKISGSAQRRIKGKILQHGPILLDFDPELNAKCFKTISELDTKEQLERRITSLQQENKPTTHEQLIEALKAGFEHTFNTPLEIDQLTEAEKQLAKELETQKTRVERE